MINSPKGTRTQLCQLFKVTVLYNLVKFQQQDVSSGVLTTKNHRRENIKYIQPANAQHPMSESQNFPSQEGCSWHPKWEKQFIIILAKLHWRGEWHKKIFYFWRPSGIITHRSKCKCWAIYKQNHLSYISTHCIYCIILNITVLNVFATGNISRLQVRIWRSTWVQNRSCYIFSNNFKLLVFGWNFNKQSKTKWVCATSNTTFYN